MTRPHIEVDTGKKERDPECIWHEGNHRVVVTFDLNGPKVHLEKKLGVDLLGHERWELVKVPYDIVPESLMRSFAILASGDEDILK